MTRRDFLGGSIAAFAAAGALGVHAAANKPLSPRVEGSVLAQQLPEVEGIDQLMRRSHARGIFNGNVLVARKGHVVYEHAFGYADATLKVPLRVDFRFNIGSITKEFSAVAIMIQLVSNSGGNLGRRQLRLKTVARLRVSPTTRELTKGTGEFRIRKRRKDLGLQ